MVSEALNKWEDFLQWFLAVEKTKTKNPTIWGMMMHEIENNLQVTHAILVCKCKFLFKWDCYTNNYKSQVF